MALMGHVSAEMTSRYATLASPRVRAAYETAMTKVSARQSLFVRPAGPSAAPDRVDWLRSEMLKTRVAHGYCSRDLIAEACPYANIWKQCDNYVAAPEFQPALEAQLADVIALRDDADDREWESETERHNRVIESFTAVNWIVLFAAGDLLDAGSNTWDSTPRTAAVVVSSDAGRATCRCYTKSW